MIAFFIIISLFPSTIQRIIRNAFGASIARGARILPFSFVPVRDLKMESGSRIGPFVFIRSKHVSMQRGATIRPLNFIKVRSISLAEGSIIDPIVLINCDYGPRSSLKVGRSSRIFSFCVIEPSEGVTIGAHVGIGGQCLIFCHGSWPNYLEGGPHGKGPVTIDDEVWIPWRVMILPNTQIGARAVIGAHSLVRGIVPSGQFYSGVPAKLIPVKLWESEVDEDSKRLRIDQIIESFHIFHEEKYRGAIRIREIRNVTQDLGSSSADLENVFFSFDGFEKDEREKIAVAGGVIDFSSLRTYSLRPIGSIFAAFLSSYGIRVLDE